MVVVIFLLFFNIKIALILGSVITIIIFAYLIIKGKICEKYKIPQLIEQMETEHKVILHSIGVLYPEGNMGDKTQFLFNHEDIEEVISKGYTDETWEDFIKRMREFYKEI